MRHRIILLSLVILLALAYFPLNHIPAHHNLRLGIDSHINLVPIFGIPYLLFWPVFWIFIVYSLFRSPDFKSLALAIIATYSLSYLIYLVYPTEVVRPALTHNDYFYGLVRWIYSHDRPFCEFPSLHTGSVAIFAIYVWRAGISKLIVIPAMIFAVTVAVSTVFLKQHYVAGLLSGLLVGGAFSLIMIKANTQFEKREDNK